MTMTWQMVQVTAAATETMGYRTGDPETFTGTEREARAEIERRAASGLKCFACRMDRRRGMAHLRAPNGAYITSIAGTI